MKLLNLEDIKIFEQESKNKLNYLKNDDFIRYKYGFLYLVINKENTKVKIGVSSNIYKRIYDINSYTPLDSIYISDLCSNMYDIELIFKKLFKNTNLHGEWFDSSKFENYLNYLNKEVYLNNFITKEEFLLDNLVAKKKSKQLFELFKVKDNKDNMIKFLLKSIPNEEFDREKIVECVSKYTDIISQDCKVENDINNRSVQLIILNQLCNIYKELNNVN